MYRQLRHAILAALLGAVWILTPMLSVVHVALEPHVYCAEHGILEEGGTHLATGDAATEADSRASRSGEERVPKGGSHTACAFGELATRDIVGFEVSVAIEKAFPGRPSGTPLDQRVKHSPVGLLLVAPKTSPPLAT
jgi:hypothetical protein